MLLHRLQLALEKKSLCKIPIAIWERKLGRSNQHDADLKALTVTWITAFTVRLYMQKFWPKKRALLGGRTRWKQAVRLWQSMDGGVWSPLLKNLALVQFLLAFLSLLWLHRSLKCSLVLLFAQQELMLLKEGYSDPQFLRELLISLPSRQRGMLLLRWIPLPVVIWAQSQRKSRPCLSRWVSRTWRKW